MFECYRRRVLYLDLTSRRSRVGELDDGLIHDYIGGMGIGTRLVTASVDPQVDPFDAGNRVVVSVGPLNGTLAPMFAQTCLVTKSPLTGGVVNTYCGGHLAAALKGCGFDAVVLDGCCDRLSYVVVTSEGVSFEYCPDWQGRSTREVEEDMRRRTGQPGLEVMSIGLAGEKRVRFASVMSATRAMGRGGAGAVLGSKNLKALGFAGDLPVRVARPEEFYAATLRMRQVLGQAMDDRYSLLGMFSREGTGAGLQFNNRQHSLATRNHSSGCFEGGENIDGTAYADRFPTWQVACHSCPVHCGQAHLVSHPRYGEFPVRGPEYETMYSLGSDCCNDDPVVLALAHNLCEEYGMDTLSAGCTAAFAMECFERGIISAPETGGVDISFGNGEGLLALLHMMARREAIGAVLAEGTRRAAAILGHGSEAFAMNVKGMEFAAWMPQRMRGIALTFATSNRGACHKRAIIGDELMGRIPMESTEGKAKLIAEIQDKVNALFTLVGCRFAEFSVPFEDFVHLLNLAAGTSYDSAALMRVGERIWNLERAFNMAAGWDASLDSLPDRCFEPLPTGEKPLTREEVALMVSEYYRIRGWDEQGRPTREKLASLGLREWAECLTAR
ncbi:MAG TPA: aldehyde ferredoxin oxidoreductase family protein [Firmicutes bacterium]|nr:aldehyde ferredoxin oxidoreductase family protein [Bacillota bacterium]